MDIKRLTACILAVCERQDGLCMDVPSERRRLARAIAHAITSSITSSNQQPYAELP
jgi:hypothetical protein